MESPAGEGMCAGGGGFWLKIKSGSLAGKGGAGRKVLGPGRTEPAPVCRDRLSQGVFPTCP